MKRHQLIGAEVSYYTAKVRAYLLYKQIPFDEVAATREVYRNVIVPRTGVRFIPVLLSDDDVAVQDSTAIIDYLERRYPAPAIDPATDVQRLIALLFELYADEWLLLPAMHYRWNVPENRAFAIEEFGRLSAPQLSQEEQRALGEKLAGPFAGALPALGVHPGTVPAIEASYRALLAELAEHFREHPFLLGTRPSIGDFALFGPLYAHLYRDPASGRMMNALAPEVARWIERMRTPKPDAGDFLDRDQVPETLMPPLARMFREFAPVLAKTIAKLAEFVPDPSRASLPRAIGTHCFELDSAQGERAIYPFNVWRFQRAHDHYQRLTGAARARADELLERALGLSLLRTPLTRRLVRVNNQLAFSS